MIATENPEGKRGVGGLQGGSGQRMVCVALIGTKITALMETAWLFVLSDVLGHHCHLFNTGVTTKQPDLSFCTSDSPLSGLVSQKRSFADRGSYARKTEGLSLILCSLCPICQEHLSAEGEGGGESKTWISLAPAQHNQDSSSLWIDSRAPRSNKTATMTTATKKAKARLAQVGFVVSVFGAKRSRVYSCCCFEVPTST